MDSSFLSELFLGLFNGLLLSPRPQSIKDEITKLREDTNTHIVGFNSLGEDVFSPVFWVICAIFKMG